MLTAAYRNIRLLYIRIALALIAVFPGRYALIIAFACLRATLSAFVGRGHWPAIIDFHRALKAKGRCVLFISRYYFEQNLFKVFAAAYFQTTRLRPRAYTENLEQLRRTRDSGQGAVLLGVHCGNDLKLLLLEEAGVDYKFLVSDNFYKRISRVRADGIGVLVSDHFKYLMDSKRLLIAGRAEKSMVSHLRRGGAAAFDLDYPRQDSRGLPASFFGKDFIFSTFPFKLSLRYDLPVFFYSFIRTGGRYVLRFHQLDEFSSPEQGLNLYLAMVEKHIRQNPALWPGTPQYSQWVRSISGSGRSETAKEFARVSQ